MMYVFVKTHGTVYYKGWIFCVNYTLIFLKGGLLMLVGYQILTVQGRGCAVTQRERRGMCRTYAWAASYYYCVQYKKINGRKKQINEGFSNPTQGQAHQGPRYLRARRSGSLYSIKDPDQQRCWLRAKGIGWEMEDESHKHCLQPPGA